VIAKVKHAMAEKKEENEKLRHELDEAKTALAKMEEDSKDTEAHEEEINNYREAVDVLKKKLEEGASTIRIHEQDKTKLRLEVGRLNSDFTEVISQFERELSLSCEASEVALREKHKECEAVQVALDKSKAELMRMRSELANAEGQDNESSQTMLNLRCELSEKETKLENTLLNLDTSIECNSKHEKTIRKLREELNELESEKEEAETLLGQLEVSKAEEAQTYQGVVEQLEGKIQEVMSSLEENREFYQDLRSECAKLKEEKEALEAENVELSANISSLAKAQADLSVDCAKQKEEIAKVAALKEENETLKAQIERQHESVDFIENQLENIREEVKTTEEARQKSIKETGVAKEELLKAMLKLDDLTNTNQQQRGQIDNLQDEVMTIKGAQEELKRVTAELDNAQKLTAENEDSMLELKNNIQSLQSQVKSIESAKEESRQMYERDISLQQAEVETLRVKHNDTQTKLDSLSKLVTNLKAALESEKENAQILLSQFKKSEADRKSHVKQKGELEAELARMLMADQTKTEQIRNLEGVERKLQKSEVELTDLRVKKEELNELRLQMLETENLHNDTITELKSKIEADKKQFISMEEKISSLESHILSLQQEFKRTLHKKEEEASQLRVTLQESTDKLWNENRDLKQGNDESLQSLQHMLNDAIRSRANTDATLQESLQLLEQQKRIDIKRKGEIAKLEQTVEILKSKERYLESYVQSLKKQIRRS
jgi:chromosome segregation ATPase